MSEITVLLPESLSEFVQQQVIQARFNTSSDYISQLIREDAQRVEREQIDALLREAQGSFDPKQVVVLRIVHGACNIESILGEGG